VKLSCLLAKFKFVIYKRYTRQLANAKNSNDS
jgi:hypothetical protein